MNPTLGRTEAVAPSAQVKGSGLPIVAGEARKWGLNRKQSGAGLSESGSLSPSLSPHLPWSISSSFFLDPPSS